MITIAVKVVKVYNLTIRDFCDLFKEVCEMLKCVPIMAIKLEEAVNLVGELANKDCDYIEWRIDTLDDKIKPELLAKAWNNMKELTDKPIIVTLRTTSQGGKARLSISKYNQVIRKLIDIIHMDYLDVEITTCGGDARAKMFAKMAAQRNIKTILSYHDIQYTTSARDIEMMLCRLKYIGADIPKVAYTANNMEDVENLKEGALKAHKVIGDLVAISMGELGKETRVNGDEIGSVINYTKPIGTAVQASDDLGQIEL